MLNLVEPFKTISVPRKDLLYSYYLHDLIRLRNSGVDGEYTAEGLIGHLAMLAIEIDKVASKHNIKCENTL